MQVSTEWLQTYVIGVCPSNSDGSDKELMSCKVIITVRMQSTKHDNHQSQGGVASRESPGVAAVVRYPCTSIVSLTAKGNPHSGVIACPLAYLASTAAASANTCRSHIFSGFSPPFGDRPGCLRFSYRIVHVKTSEGHHLTALIYLCPVHGDESVQALKAACIVVTQESLCVLHGSHVASTQQGDGLGCREVCNARVGWCQA